ncbi:MAG: type II toxin-antitoxin system RelE/ParE family toxin [Actinomyces succiniciruminis]|nr:type II toxin-antitoxin system RelE/ParE family toxin [Actinomyces succiniciruminis]
MEVRYVDSKLEAICTDERRMRRALNATVAKTLKRRLTELYRFDSFDDLLAGTGRWERLRANRSGQWSARLDKNWRLIVIDEGGSPVVARVIDIVDYH